MDALCEAMPVNWDLFITFIAYGFCHSGLFPILELGFDTWEAPGALPGRADALRQRPPRRP